MVIGVGVDMVKLEHLAKAYLDPDDPFCRRTYSQLELVQARLRDHALAYYATRFAGKEAVFKALNWGHEPISLCDIEILNDETGQPQVNLHGAVKIHADSQGITCVKLSLSFDTDYAIAFAITQSE